MFKKGKRKSEEIPCVYCAHTPMPVFLRSDLEKCVYGLLSYETIRPELIAVLNKDIPHRVCREHLLMIKDKEFDYQQKGFVL